MAGVNRSARGKFHTPNPSEPGVLTRHPGWKPSPNPFTFSITTSSRPCFSTRYALENRIPRNPFKTNDGDTFHPVQKATPPGEYLPSYILRISGPRAAPFAAPPVQPADRRASPLSCTRPTTELKCGPQSTDRAQPGEAPSNDITRHISAPRRVPERAVR
jgi:hypothetical protein